MLQILKSNKKNILLIGYGSIGKKYYSFLKETHNLHIFDIKFYKFKNKILLEKLKLFLKINSNKINYAVICTPPDQRIEYYRLMIKYNINFLAEKPICNNLHGLTQINSLINKKRLKAAISCNMLFDNFYTFFRNKIIKTKQNKLIHINFLFSFDLKNMRAQKDKRGYYLNNSKGGGVLNDVLSHELQLLTKFFGKIKSIKSLVRQKKEKNSIYDSLSSIILEFNSDITACIDVNYLSNYRERLIHFYFNKFKIIYSETDKPIKSEIIISNRNKLKKIKLKKNNSLKDQLLYFEEKILSGKKKYNKMITFEEGINFLKIIKKIRNG